MRKPSPGWAWPLGARQGTAHSPVGPGSWHGLSGVGGPGSHLPGRAGLLARALWGGGPGMLSGTGEGARAVPAQCRPRQPGRGDVTHSGRVGSGAQRFLAVMGPLCRWHPWICRQTGAGRWHQHADPCVRTESRAQQVLCVAQGTRPVSSRAWSQLELELSPAPRPWLQPVAVPGCAGWAPPCQSVALFSLLWAGSLEWGRRTGGGGWGPPGAGSGWPSCPTPRP